MLAAFGSSFPCCDGITRRNFLQLGAPLLGLGIADLLRAQAVANEGGQPVSPNKKSLIVFWTNGGMSQQASAASGNTEKYSFHLAEWISDYVFGTKSVNVPRK